MSSLLKEKKGVGVIVCRMQVPYLTTSHQAIVKTALERHPRVVIFLGVSMDPMDEKNPYPFQFRKEMIEKTFFNRNILIVPLHDIKDNNKLWVETLDRFITSFIGFDEDAVLYGGRDSFIPYYKKDKGKYDTIELEPTDYDSGTELRALSSIVFPKYSPEVASCILWTMRQLKKSEVNIEPKTKTDLELLEETYNKLGVKYHKLVNGDYTYIQKFRAHEKEGIIVVNLMEVKLIKPEQLDNYFEFYKGSIASW